MMLSELERIGLKEILDDVDDGDVCSILETVTRRMYSTENRNEAIKVILSCTQHPVDLLKRQKIAKKILFNYLIKKGVPVSSEWSKQALTDECLKLWDSTTSCEASGSTASGRTVTVLTENQSCVSSGRTEEMGVEFSKWFFRALNYLDHFGPQHFWPSCNLSAQLLSLNEQKEVSLSGANDVASFLTELISIHKYFFHANESKESIVLHIEQHGLVNIMIPGVLHKNSNLVGLFESAFGLAKHPDSPDTYKIQVIKMRMQVNMETQRTITAC